MEVLSVRKYKAGYEVRTQEYQGEEVGLSPGETLIMKNAYNSKGQWIGLSKEAYRLIVKRGIMPEYRNEDSNVCSIGFCEDEQKWYGWSHRAICGFEIGGKIFEENTPGATDDTPFVEYGTQPIVTLEDARQAASNFAKYVS